MGVGDGAAGVVRLSGLFGRNRLGKAGGGDAAGPDARGLCGQAEDVADMSGKAVASKTRRKFLCWLERVGTSRDRHRATTWNGDRASRCERLGRDIAWAKATCRMLN